MPQKTLEARQAYRKAYYEKNKERLKQKARDQRDSDPEYYKEYYRNKYHEKRESNYPMLMLRAAKQRARIRGQEFTITEEDIVIPEVCPYLGIKLELGTGRMQDASPSLDKIRPELGYVPGNVEVISNRANRLKCDASPEELEMIATRLRTIL